MYWVDLDGERSYWGVLGGAVCVGISYVLLQRRIKKEADKLEEKVNKCVDDVERAIKHREVEAMKTKLAKEVALEALPLRYRFGLCALIAILL